MSLSLPLLRPEPLAATGISFSGNGNGQSLEATSKNMKHSSILAIFALLSTLVVIGICYKKIDFLPINEVKTLISIIFGFATSCFLLSVIWVIQEKRLSLLGWPINNSCLVNSFVIVDPSNGQSASDNNNNHARNSSEGRRSTICTIFPRVDQPPNYEDALINSKPISYVYLPDENCCLQNQKVGQQSNNAPSINQNCNNHKLSVISNESVKLNSFLRLQDVAGDCETQDTQQQNDIHRKASLCQLNAYQLMLLSSSPPNYEDLFQISIDYNNATDSNSNSLHETNDHRIDGHH